MKIEIDSWVVYFWPFKDAAGGEMSLWHHCEAFPWYIGMMSIKGKNTVKPCDGCGKSIPEEVIFLAYLTLVEETG